MQYIQFQPQNPGDVSVAPLGSYNLFIDASGSVSVKNDSGSSSPVGSSGFPYSGSAEITGSLGVTGSIFLNGVEVTTGGGGAAVQEVNGYSELQTLISGSLLISGALYKINNAASYSLSELGYVQADGVTVFLTAVTSASFDRRGVGLFWNPNYADSSAVAGPNEYRVWDNTTQFTYNTPSGGFFNHIEDINWGDNSYIGNLATNVGDSVATFMYYSSVLNTGSKDVWDSIVTSLPTTVTGSSTGATIQLTGVNYSSSYSIGDKVIWGNRVWSNISGYTGDAGADQMNLNVEDWEIVPFNDTDYTLVANDIEYDYETNYITLRKDHKNSNEVYSSYADTAINGWFNGIAYFPWGHKNVKNCKIDCLYVALAAVDKSLVNFPNYDGAAAYLANSIDSLQIKRANFSSFRWGRGTSMYSVSLEEFSTFNSCRFGDSSNIFTIYLKPLSSLSGVITYDNDYGDYTLYRIDLYREASLNSLYLHTRSGVGQIVAHERAELYNFILYPNADVYNFNVGTEGNIYSITAGIDSYFDSIHAASYSSISNLSVGANSYFYSIKANEDSFIGIISVGDNSNVEDIEAETYSSLSSITLGNNAYFGDLNIGRYGYMGSITINSGAYVQNVQTSNNFEISNITLAENSSIWNFEMLEKSSMKFFTLDTGSAYNNFLISQNCQLAGGSNLFSGSKSNRVISKNFNNFYDNPILIGSASYVTNPNELPQINATHTQQVIDLSGVSYGPVMYYLADADLEGQEVSFVYKSDGTYDGGGSNSPQNLQIWIENARTSLGTLQSGSSFNWYPFSKDGTSTWRSYAKCVWNDGAWTTDNGAWD